MKKIYLQPATTVVRVEIEQMVAESLTSVSTNLSGSDNITYGGGNSCDARVKDAGYNVWNDDWSE